MNEKLSAFLNAHNEHQTLCALFSDQLSATGPKACSTRTAQRGSALLIVFVFAAFVAIMLYRELPVAAFEAKRQKEQLLIDRGNEYAHAVKLYVRRLGNYPASFEQLENTNRMRFLRHRFKDPLTGKDEWRVLHAGPGGMLVDSKVNPLSNAPNTNASNFSSPFGASSSSTSNSSATNSSATNSSANPETVVPQVPQRPPAVAANSSGGEAGPPGTQTDQGLGIPFPQGNQAQQPNQPGSNATTMASATDPSGAPLANAMATGSQSGAAPAANTMATGTQPPNTPPGQSPMANAMATSSGAPPAAASNPMESVRSLLNNPNPTSSAPQPRTGGTPASFGRISTGGIAGVASKAEGRTIKTVNDQSDYSLWEFFYDPSKDTMRGLAGGMRPGGTAPQGQRSGFGSSPGASSFGSAQPAMSAPSGLAPPNVPPANPPR